MRSPSPDQTRRWIRVPAFILGIALMIWLPFEDGNTKLAFWFAVFISALVTTFLLTKDDSLTHRSFAYPLAGFLAGLAVGPLAILLMVFKNGVHSHGTPDYSLAQVLNVLWLTPFCAAAGLAIGLGIAVRQSGSGRGK